ncbi:AI-2E family transporter [Niallia sp. Krafla_26]|uniref:AI-2E family transporter n=1 Tax=Niallia sp. Krafla_26 TaxID=3064703 RepID=UPI003D1758C0
MNFNPSKIDIFKKFILNNRFVIFLIILLLIGLNILVFKKVSFIFTPIVVFFQTVVLPIVLSAIFYYLFVPIVDYFERKGVKRIYSIIVLYLLIIGILTILIVSVIPLLRDQIMRLIVSFPHLVIDIERMIEQVIGSQFLNEVQQTLNFNVSDLAIQVSNQATTILNSTFTGIGNIIGSVSKTIMAIITVPFILFYLLKDGKKLPDYILKFLPTLMRSHTFTVLREMNKQISSYIRGQIVVSLCIGLLMLIGFLIIGLDYAPVLALIAGFTSIVPYLGPAIAITPALIIAIVTSPYMLLKLIIVWTIVQLIEGKLISPQIMGRNLHIHPITIIFIIIIAGNLFGVVGILLAVPGYAILKVITTHLFEYFKIRSQLYEDTKIEQPK